MVLKRPYAFLIKHFRLIHLIITVIFAYIAILTRDTYKYLNSVISDSLNKYNAQIYINYSVFIFIFIALALCAVVFLLLKYKDKPRRIYILTIASYILLSIFIFALFSYMQGFSNNIIDQKTIRLYRDILLMIQFFEYYITIFMFIRGLGFDIKKFNFAKDAQELNATLEDSEEVEIDTNIDTTNVIRTLRKKKREFGYFYKEFKIYIIILITIIIIILGNKIFNYYTDKFKIYQENNTIGNKYRISIKNSYYTFDEEQKYIIINFDIDKKGAKESFDIGNMILKIGRKTYTPNKNICYKFSKLGTCYKTQYISSNPESYIIVYDIEKINSQNVYLLYDESYDKIYKIKLNIKEKND